MVTVEKLDADVNLRTHDGLSCLREILLQASDQDIEAGMQWYPNAHWFAVQLAEADGLSVEQACAIVSALSANKGWRTNCDLAVQCVTDQPVGHTQPTVRKAKTARTANKPWRVFKSTASGKTDTCGKTRAFYHSILYPHSRRWNAVTVDRHTFAAWLGFVPSDELARKLGNVGVRERIQKHYTELGLEFGLTGVQAQAIIWITFRRMKGLTDG